MSEPRRLLHDPAFGDEDARAMLAAAKDDHPSDADRAALAAMLGIAAPTATAVAASKAVERTEAVARLSTISLGHAALLAKGMAALALAIGIAFVVAPRGEVARERAPEARATASAERAPGAEANAMPRPSPMGAGAPRGEAPKLPEAMEAPEAPEANRAPAEERRDARRGARVREASEPQTVSVDALARETELVARAKALIGARRLREAREALDAYETVAPHGLLEEEALALRVDLFAAQGAPLAALEGGRAFLERFPRSAHAARVRATLEALDAGSARVAP